MYCTECGAKNSDTARYCRNCGQILTKQEVPDRTVSEDTVPLDAAAVDGPFGEDPSGMGQPACGNQSYGDQQSYDGQQTYGNQSYDGQQTYGNQSYGSRQLYGNQSYDGQQTYGNQAYDGRPPYGDQVYGGQQPYGNQSYGGQQPYGNMGYGSQSYGGGGYQQAGQPVYGQNPYGNPSYYAGDGNRPKKKGKKGIVVAVILLLLAALAGGGAFLFIKENDPMAPVDQLFSAVKEGKWEKAYDSIYWGDSGSPNWVSKDEFTQKVKSSMGEVALMTGVLDGLAIEKVSEGETYKGDDGLTRQKLTVRMSIHFMGMDQSQDVDLVVVKSGRKFLFIPVWKIDNEAMEELF